MSTKICLQNEKSNPAFRPLRLQCHSTSSRTKNGFTSCYCTDSFRLLYGQYGSAAQHPHSGYRGDKSKLAKRTNNLYGIKCGDGWKGERSRTWRKYGSRNESVADFCQYIIKHYPFLIGKPLSQWTIKGYAEKPYKF